MKKKTLGLTILLAITLLAGTALAHRNAGGMMGGCDAGDGYGFCDRYDNIDREGVTAITDKYADQFDALQTRMEAKRDEMLKARRNDATTMGQMNSLRDEMFKIKKEYRGLAGKVDDELSEKFGELNDDDHYGMMGGGRHHRGMKDGQSHRRMMGESGGYGGCR